MWARRVSSLLNLFKANLNLVNGFAIRYKRHKSCLRASCSSLKLARPERRRSKKKLGGFQEALFQINSEDKDRRHNMYAVIESGGKQHRVEPGEVLQLEKLDVVEGETIDFENVMLIGEGEKVSIGRPYIEGGKVSAEVLSHGRRDKITIIKMRRRKHYRRQAGHRQHFTEVKITEISGDS